MLVSILVLNLDRFTCGWGGSTFDRTFSNLPTGGPSCEQTDRTSFTVMRYSQYFVVFIVVLPHFYRYPPFYDEKPFGIYEKILQGKIEWPKHMDPVAK